MIGTALDITVCVYWAIQAAHESHPLYLTGELFVSAYFGLDAIAEVLAWRAMR